MPPTNTKNPNPRMLLIFCMFPLNSAAHRPTSPASYFTFRILCHAPTLSFLPPTLNLEGSILFRRFLFARQSSWNSVPHPPTFEGSFSPRKVKKEETDHGLLAGSKVQLAGLRPWLSLSGGTGKPTPNSLRWSASAFWLRFRLEDEVDRLRFPIPHGDFSVLCAVGLMPCG